MTNRTLESNQSGFDDDEERSEFDRTSRTRDTGTEGGPRLDDPTDVEEPAPPPLPLDAVFEVLKNERRRITLQYLKSQDGEVSLSDLAEHVAIEENDISPTELTSTVRKRAYVGLYQCHLPKMDDLGVVSYNRDRGIIAEGPNVDQLDPYLDAPADADPWPTYYLILSAVAGAVFVGALSVGAALGGAASTALTGAGGLVPILAFAGLATYHHLSSRTDDDGD